MHSNYYAVLTFLYNFFQHPLLQWIKTIKCKGFVNFYKNTYIIKLYNIYKNKNFTQI